MYVVQDKLVAIGGQCSQGHGFLDPEYARLRRTFRAGGVDERLGFGDGHIGGAAIVADHLVEFNCPTGTPGM